MNHEEKILIALHEQTGLSAPQIGEERLRKEIRQQLKNCSNPDRLLDTHSQEWKEFIHATLVPETWFFRNPEAFDAFIQWSKEVWFPTHSTPLRILSLPCATGEEPYSLAIRLFEAGCTPNQFTILAGDLGKNFLEHASQAVYGNNSFRSSFNEKRFGRYFTQLPNGKRKVIDEVRHSVRFQVMNLMSGELPKADVVFCRNVLIYFDEIRQKQTLERLHSILDDDGILFLGPVEPPIALRYGFASHDFPMAFSCRKDLASQSSQVPFKIKQPKQVARTKKPRLAPPPKKATPTPKAAVVIDSTEHVRTLANQGNLTAAADMLSRLTHTDDAPSAELYCLCGTVHEALKEPEAAERFYRKAMFLDPNHTETLMQLHLLLHISGRPEAAQIIQRRLER